MESWKFCMICVVLFSSLCSLTFGLEVTGFHQVVEDVEPRKSFGLIDFGHLGNSDTLVGAMLPFGLLKDQFSGTPSFTIVPRDGPRTVGTGGTSIKVVFFLTLLSALASGAGALPFFCIRRIPTFWVGVSNSLAAGIMLLASLSLMYEGLCYDAIVLLLGLVCGVIFVVQTQGFLDRYENLKFGNLKGVDAKRVLLIMTVMTLHSLAEGVGMGVSFGGGEELGLFITGAMAVHNLPEGLAVGLVVVPRGFSPTAAVLWATASSLPQPLMALPAFLFVDLFAPILPWGLGFAAGAMGYLVYIEMIPEAVKETKSKTVVAVGMVLAVLGMAFFQYEILGRWIAAEPHTE